MNTRSTTSQALVQVIELTKRLQAANCILVQLEDVSAYESTVGQTQEVHYARVQSSLGDSFCIFCLLVLQLYSCTAVQLYLEGSGHFGTSMGQAS